MNPAAATGPDGRIYALGGYNNGGFGNALRPTPPPPTAGPR